MSGDASSSLLFNLLGGTQGALTAQPAMTADSQNISLTNGKTLEFSELMAAQQVLAGGAPAGTTPLMSGLQGSLPPAIQAALKPMAGPNALGQSGKPLPANSWMLPLLGAEGQSLTAEAEAGTHAAPAAVGLDVDGVQAGAQPGSFSVTATVPQLADGKAGQPDAAQMTDARNAPAPAAASVAPGGVLPEAQAKAPPGDPSLTLTRLAPDGEAERLPEAPAFNRPAPAAPGPGADKSAGLDPALTGATQPLPQAVAMTVNRLARAAAGAEGRAEPESLTAVTQASGTDTTSATSTTTTGTATAAGVANQHSSATQSLLNTAAADTQPLPPMNRPGWGEAVAEKVMWMSAQNLSKAEIQLDPPELGHLQIRVSTQQDQTSVSFVSQHASVRDALDQAMPRLRELLDSQGLDLVDVDVSDRGASDGGDGGETPASLAGGDSADDESVPGEQSSVAAQTPLNSRQGSSLVDDYA